MPQGTVTLIAGRIASGKTTFARTLCADTNAVPLSMDDLTWQLLGNEQGPYYDAFCTRAQEYLLRLAVSMARSGCSTVLDWGFWTKQGRDCVRAFLDENQVRSVWYCIDLSDADWERNIAERNARIGSDTPSPEFFVTEGLKAKCLALWEQPGAAEDIIHVPFRRAGSR